jgi:hypothetical protein
VNLNYHEIEHLADRVVFLGRDGVRLAESVDCLKARTRMVIADELPEGYPLLLTENVMGGSRYIVYPFDNTHGDIHDAEIREMDLTEIMTAFMEGEYHA